MTSSRKLFAAALAAAIVMAACSDDKKTTDATTAAVETTVADTAVPDTAVPDTAVPDTAVPDDPMAALEADVAGLAVVPTKIGPTIPLKSVPEAKTVAWLECSLPSCAAIGVGFKDAIAKIGWKLEVISWTTDAAAAFQQAIDLGVDYIAITGTAPELIQDQIDAAKAAGIAFFSCYDTADPGQDANNIWTQCGDEVGVTKAGENLAKKVIVDSKGKANVLMVNIPDFAVLAAERDGSAATYKASCPECKFTELALTLDQLLAGEVAGAVVTAVQSDPSINYIHFAFDGIAGGVVQTLADANLLEGRTLVGVDFSGVILQDIVDGKQKFWTANPKPYAAWLMVDAMARNAIGQDNTEERANSILPTFIVDNAAQAQPLIASDGWPGPEGMADQFAALWGV